jgi:hypothetical protein
MSAVVRPAQARSSATRAGLIDATAVGSARATIAGQTVPSLTQRTDPSVVSEVITVFRTRS